MQAGRGSAAKPPIGIAIEGDLGDRVDALLAVAMLNGLAAKGEARKIAICVSRPSLKSAQLADVVTAFYSGRPVPGPGGAVGGNPDMLIGMPDGAVSASDHPPLAAILSRTTSDDTPYTSVVTRPLDTADDAILLRNMLLAQNDGDAAIVLAGPASGLVRLLSLYGARPEIAAKVSQLVVAVGAFPTGPSDAALAGNLAAARRLFAEWPTPIVAAGAELGQALPYPASSIESDFGWSKAHPIADAYRAFKPMPYDAPASALAAVLYAARPEDGLFKLSDAGTIAVLDGGRTQFTAGAGGRHRYLIADPAQQAQVIKRYRDLVSAQPAPRPVRGRGNAAAAQQKSPAQQAPPPPAQAPKPGEAKPPTP